MNARLQVGHPITTGERVTVTGKDGLLVDYRPKSLRIYFFLSLVKFLRDVYRYDRKLFLDVKPW
jgi:hypothetical protein